MFVVYILMGAIDERNKYPDPICAIASTEKVKCACRKAKFYGKMLLAKQNHLHVYDQGPVVRTPFSLNGG